MLLWGSILGLDTQSLPMSMMMGQRSSKTDGEGKGRPPLWLSIGEAFGQERMLCPLPVHSRKNLVVILSVVLAHPRQTLCPVFIEGAKSGDVVVVALSVDAGGLLTVEISGDEGELFVSRTLNVLDRSSKGQIFNERSRKLEELERKFARYSYLFDADLECRVTQLFEYVKCLQWSDDKLWKDAFSVLELASDRIARAVKYR